MDQNEVQDDRICDLIKVGRLVRNSRRLYEGHQGRKGLGD